MMSAEREEALAASVVRRRVIDAAERAAKPLIDANVGLHRLSASQYERYREATAAIERLIQVLKFNR